MCRGADKEASDEDSATPLVLAAAWGKAHAVNALIEGGAEVNTTDKDGKSAVYWAAQEGHVEVLKVGICGVKSMHKFTWVTSQCLTEV